MAGWFATTPQRDAHTILVALPHAGASAGVYREYPARIGPGVEVRAVRYPGHADRLGEPLETDCGQLARDIVTALRPDLSRPLALFGHSIGALVAFEIAAVLEQHYGVTPTRLIVSGAPAPHRPARDSLRSTSSDAELITELLALAGDGNSALDSPEIRELFLPVLRADFRLGETYHPPLDKPIAAPILAFGGADDPVADAADLDAWGEYTTGPFHRETFPGGHFYLFDESAPAVLARLATLLGGDKPQAGW